MMDDRESEKVRLRVEALLPLLLLIYIPYQLLYLPYTESIEWYSVISEGSVAFFLILALWLTAKMDHHPKVYWPLLLGFTSLLFSTVTDVLDEFFQQTEWLEIIFEDILQFLAYPLIVAGLFQWNFVNQQLRSELQKQVATDYLTQVLNRRGFMKAFKQEITRSRRYGSPLSLIWFDLDRFKALNDQYGHHAGDEVLINVARLTANLLRQVDVFARMGGEEFCIIMPETPIDGAVEVAQKLREAFEDFDGMPGIAITASFGVGEYRTGEDADQFMKRVDDALYRAKAQGRNRVLVE